MSYFVNGKFSFHCKTRERVKAIRKGKKLQKGKETRKWTAFFLSLLCLLALVYQQTKNEKTSLVIEFLGHSVLIRFILGFQNMKSEI